MKLTVVCQVCGKILSTIEKDQVSQEDINMYKAMSICPTDYVEEIVPVLDLEGTPTFDDGGNPITKTVRTSDIVAVKTED